MYVNLDWAFVDPWVILHGTEIIQSEVHNHTPFQNGRHFSVLLFTCKSISHGCLVPKLEIQKNIFLYTRQQGLICK